MPISGIRDLARDLWHGYHTLRGQQRRRRRDSGAAAVATPDLPDPANAGPAGVTLNRWATKGSPARTPHRTACSDGRSAGRLAGVQPRRRLRETAKSADGAGGERTISPFLPSATLSRIAARPQEENGQAQCESGLQQRESTRLRQSAFHVQPPLSARGGCPSFHSAAPCSALGGRIRRRPKCRNRGRRIGAPESANLLAARSSA
jgi:hypothetical protein